METIETRTQNNNSSKDPWEGSWGFGEKYATGKDLQKKNYEENSPTDYSAVWETYN